jgi:hypothetical protein
VSRLCAECGREHVPGVWMPRHPFRPAFPFLDLAGPPEGVPSPGVPSPDVPMMLREGFSSARITGGVLGRMVVSPGDAAGVILTARAFAEETNISAVVFSYVRGPWALAEVAVYVGPSILVLPGAALTKSRTAWVLSNMPIRIRASEAFRVGVKVHASARKPVIASVSWVGIALGRGAL